MSIWEKTFDVLSEAGIEVYPPATKKGECQKKYVVVKQDGSVQIGNLSSEHNYYQFLIYVPKNQYQTLDGYEKEVKKVLAEKMYPTLMPVGEVTTDYYDEEIKAHMRSFLFRNNVRNKHL